jgi:hypothetical protein
MAAHKPKLTTVERERITDSVLKVQSVRASLEQVDEKKVPKLDEMEECLEDVDDGLREVLGYGRHTDSADSAPTKPPKDDETNR